jgi:16S rRNA (adenine(1408)-N(1))-methyltransferase
VEILQGKHSRPVDAAGLAVVLNGYREILIDLGTGDGRFVLHAARQQPALFVLGVDACRENLRDASRAAPANALFAIANVASAECGLSAEIPGLAARVTINFPWGSLRDGLLHGDARLLSTLDAMMRPGARLEVRLNASALAEAGWELGAGGEQVAQTLVSAGFRVCAARRLNAAALRSLPSTWAKRLAFGRSPEAMYICGQKCVTSTRPCEDAKRLRLRT